MNTVENETFSTKYMAVGGYLRLSGLPSYSHAFLCGADPLLHAKGRYSILGCITTGASPESLSFLLSRFGARA